MAQRPRVLTSTPVLVVSDLKRSIDFYCKQLGFEEPSVWGEPPCFAMLNRNGFELMLSVAEADGAVRPNGPTGVWDVYLRVTDLAEEIAALTSAGVKLDKGPTDTFYDMREIEVVDPDGHRWCFGQDTSSQPPENAEVWEGTLDTGASKLRLVLRLWAAGASLDSPDQGATNLPVDSVSREGGALRFEMKHLGAEFEGRATASGDEISGRWSQRGRTWPLAFKKTR